MGQCPQEAINTATNHEILQNLWDQWHIHNSPPLDFILGNMNPICINIIMPFTSRCIWKSLPSQPCFIQNKWVWYSLFFVIFKDVSINKNWQFFHVTSHCVSMTWMSKTNISHNTSIFIRQRVCLREQYVSI